MRSGVTFTEKFFLFYLEVLYGLSNGIGHDLQLDYHLEYIPCKINILVRELNFQSKLMNKYVIQGFLIPKNYLNKILF